MPEPCPQKLKKPPCFDWGRLTFGASQLNCAWHALYRGQLVVDDIETRIDRIGAHTARDAALHAGRTGAPSRQVKTQITLQSRSRAP